MLPLVRCSSQARQELLLHHQAEQMQALNCGPFHHYSRGTISTGYIVLDTQMIVGGKHSTFRFTVDDYVMAAG